MKKFKDLKNTIIASFLAKKSWKRMRKREQKLSLRFVPTRRVIENTNKIAKKFKKIKNTVMYSFQAKIGLKKMRKGENKNYRFVPFLPNTKFKIPKKLQ